MKKFSTVLVGFLSFLIPIFLATNTTLNYFYVTGGGLFDGGWFAYLSTFSTHFPPNNPSMMGGAFFDIHISPIFYLFSGINALLALIGIHFPYPVFFSLTQGVWFGLLSLACYGLFLPPSAQSEWKHIGLAFGFALIAMFNAISLSMFSFPHIEIAIPALLLIFFALLTHGYKKSSLIPLLIGLLVREDAGLDYFGFFILLSCFFYCHKKNEEALNYSKFFVKLAGGCLFYSCLAILMQKCFFSPHTMANVYLGDPPFQHVTKAFIIERFNYTLSHRSYLFIPLIFIVLLSVIYRNLLLFLGVLAVLPWIVFSFFAFSLGASSLRWYHAFPLVVTFFWPAVVYGLNNVVPISKRAYYFYWSNALFIICISMILFCLFSREGNQKTSYPWNLLSIDWTQRWKENQDALDHFFERTPVNQYTAVSISAVALELDKIKKGGFLVIDWSKDIETKKITLIIFNYKNSNNDKIKQIIEKNNLTKCMPLNNSDYCVAKKVESYNLKRHNRES